MLTETWLIELDSTVISQLKSNSYKCTQVYRISGRFGGGVGILFKNNIELLDTSSLHLPESDCLVSNLNFCNNNTYKLIVIYRPPNNAYSSFIESFQELLSTI